MIANPIMTQSNQAIRHRGHSTAVDKFSLLTDFLLKLRIVCFIIGVSDKIVTKILVMLVHNNKKSLCLREKVLIFFQRGNNIFLECNLK